MSGGPGRRGRTGARALLPRAGAARSAMLAALLLLAPEATAHDSLDVQIARLSHRIEQAPRDAELRLRRGELHRQLGEWEAAFRDLQAALALDPSLAEAELHLGSLAADLRWFPAARTLAERFLERRPDDVDGRRLLVRVLAATGQLADAVAEQDARIALLERPQPDDYFQRADLLLALGEPSRAVAGLDEGLARLGPVPSLLLKAIDVELAVGRHDAALERLAQVAAMSQRQETWLARRGDILRLAGRPQEARQAYEQAGAALAALRPRHRATAAMEQLAAHVEQSLAELAAEAAP